MNNPVPRILQILPALQSGGVEQVSVETACFLKSFDPKTPTFVASHGGRLVERLESVGATHIPLPLHTKNPLKILANGFHIRQIIKKHHIELIHARSRAPAWSALLAARLLKIPFVTTYHGIYNSAHTLKNFYNSVMARGDRVIAISRYVAEHIFHTHPEFSNRVEVIPEGIDVSLFDSKTISPSAVQDLKERIGILPSQKIILLPGRLTRWKGQEVLLKASEKIDPQKYAIILCGDAQGRSEYVRHLQKLAQNSGIRVHFMAHSSSMPVLYAASDLVVSCSTDPEAFGRVTAEALSMGRPFIGTSHGGTVELTNNGKVGDLVKPGNVNALVEAIHQFETYPSDFLQERTIQARMHIMQKYSLTLMGQKTLALYKRLIEEKA